MTYKQAFRSVISKGAKGSKRLEESINGSNMWNYLVRPKYRMVLFCHPGAQLSHSNFRKSGNHVLLWGEQFLKNPVILKSEISPLYGQSSQHLSIAVPTWAAWQTGRKLGPSPVPFCHLLGVPPWAVSHSFPGTQKTFLICTVNIHARQRQTSAP